MGLLSVMKIVLSSERIIYYMNTGRKTIQIGGSIKNARKKLDMTQEELAELVGCSSKTINNIESNKIPELKQIVNLCDVLGLSMDKLFDIALPRSKNNKNDYFTQREEAKRNLNLEDSENLNVITGRIYSLNSAQLKVIREIIDLWK